MASHVHTAGTNVDRGDRLDVCFHSGLLSTVFDVFAIAITAAIRCEKTNQ